MLKQQFSLCFHVQHARLDGDGHDTCFIVAEFCLIHRQLLFSSMRTLSWTPLYLKLTTRAWQCRNDKVKHFQRADHSLHITPCNNVVINELRLPVAERRPKGA